MVFCNQIFYEEPGNVSVSASQFTFFQLTVSRVSENGVEHFLFYVRKEEVVIIKKYFGTPGSGFCLRRPTPPF